MRNDRDVAWDIVSRQLGFRDEKDMLTALYEKSSIPEVAKVLRTSPGTVLKRLILYGIPRKPRGGMQSKSSVRYKLFHVDQRLICALGLKECGGTIGASTSSLYKYKQWKTGRFTELSGTLKNAEGVQCNSVS